MHTDYEYPEVPFKGNIIIGDGEHVDESLAGHLVETKGVRLGTRAIVEHYYEQYAKLLKESQEVIETLRNIHRLLGEVQKGTRYSTSELKSEKRHLVRDILELGDNLSTDMIDIEVEKAEKTIFGELSSIVSLANQQDLEQVLGIQDEVEARLRPKDDSSKLTSKQRKYQSMIIGKITKAIKGVKTEEELTDEQKELLKRVRSGDIDAVSKGLELVSIEDLQDLKLASREELQELAGQTFRILSEEDRAKIQEQRAKSKEIAQGKKSNEEREAQERELREVAIAEAMFGKPKKGEIAPVDKLKLFRETILAGIKDREQMDSIMRAVCHGRAEIPEHIDELHYGRKWFVAFSKETEKVTLYIDESLSQEEKNHILETEIEPLYTELQQKAHAREQEAKKSSQEI